VDGIDVWPALATGAALPERPILLNATPANGAIRVGDWKLILDDRAGGAGDGEGEEGGGGASARRQARQQATAEGDGVDANAKVSLFNLAHDLGESKNLAAEDPEKVKQLRAAYDKLAAQAAPPKVRTKDPNFKTPAVWGEP
jgi:hypothetical protein